MAITKRFRVSFDVKVVLSSEDLQEYTENLVADSKRFINGEKITGLELELARLAAQYGPEAAIELCLKSGIQRFLKKEVNHAGGNASNIRVEVRQ